MRRKEEIVKGEEEKWSRKRNKGDSVQPVNLTDN